MRHDYIRLDKKNLVPDKNGFLNIEVKATKAGVFKYRNSDGTIRRELRLPEEVFSEASMDSLKMKPVTIEHQGRIVNSTTVKEFTRGAVGENIRQDGDYVVCNIAVHDKTAVDEILKFKKLGISAGYIPDNMEMTSGKHPKYGRYDCIQRGIDYNHLTLTATPRGDGCNIRLDSDDALMIEDNSVDNNHNQKDTMTIKQKIQAFEFGGARFDSESIEFPQEAESAVSTVMARLELVQDEATKIQARFDSLSAEHDLSKKDLETKEKELKESKEHLDSAIPQEKLQDAVKARLDLERLARCDSKDIEGLSNSDLQKKIITDSKLGFDEARFDSQDYVDAAIDQIKARVAKMPKATNEHLDSFEDLNGKINTDSSGINDEISQLN